MPLTRRRFLGSSAGLVAGVPFARGFAAGEVRDKVKLAVVGVAGRGAANLAGVAGEEIVALCELDPARADAARKQFPNAEFFTDARKLFDAVGDAVEGVVVSTPDHTHSPSAVRALASKKHLYCEKPLARTVGEVRLIRAAAGTAGVVTQMGTQIHAGENYRRVVEFVQSGRLGAVSKVDVWVAGKPTAGKKLPGGKLPFDRMSGSARCRASSSGPRCPTGRTSTGGSGGRSAAARWRTSAATSSTCRSGRWA